MKKGWVAVIRPHHEGVWWEVIVGQTGIYPWSHAPHTGTHTPRAQMPHMYTHNTNIKHVYTCQVLHTSHAWRNTIFKCTSYINFIQTHTYAWSCHVRTQSHTHMHRHHTSTQHTNLRIFTYARAFMYHMCTHIYMLHTLAQTQTYIHTHTHAPALFPYL